MASTIQPEGIRRSKREQIRELFANNLGVRFGSNQLHAMFGSSLRTRISELNADPACEIEIFNVCTFQNGGECSTYWGQRRTGVGETMPMFADAGRMEHRDLG